jgi:large subunit ribosomal protein L10
MAIRLEDKKAVVAEVSEVAARSLLAVVADYRGLTVAQMTDLRSKARDSGVYLRVVRNTLARRALEGTEFECLRDTLVGPNLLAFTKDDPGAAAKLLKDYAAANISLALKVLAFGGQLIPASDIDRVANLPTREEAIARLMSVMQAPVTKLVTTLDALPSKLVRTLGAIPSKFVRTVEAIRQQKENG